jgi:death on curing protein
MNRNGYSMPSPNARPLRILSASDLININEEVTGYPPFVRDHQVLYSAVKRPFLILFGEEQFPTMLDKAAALFHSLAAHHVFIDGNKRTACRAVQVFLEANGIAPKWEQAEMQAFALRVAKGEAEIETIAAWLGEQTEEIE